MSGRNTTKENNKQQLYRKLQRLVNCPFNMGKNRKRRKPDIFWNLCILRASIAMRVSRTSGCYFICSQGPTLFVPRAQQKSTKIRAHPCRISSRCPSSLLEQIPKDEGQAQGHGGHTEAHRPKHLDHGSGAVVARMGMSETLPAQLSYISYILFGALMLDVDIYHSKICKQS